MPAPEEIVADHFREVMAELNVDWGDYGFYRGIVDDTAILCKLVADDPPRYLFMLRMTEPHHLASSWTGTLPEIYHGTGINCKMQGEYIEIIVPDGSYFTPGDLASLVRDCICHHSKFLPTEENYCYDCKTTGDVTLEQAGGTITTICEDCLQKRVVARITEEHKINASHAGWSGLLPLALILSSIGWAVFWWLYALALSNAQGDRIMIPWLLALVIVGGVGFALGWPIGKLLHRSGTVKRFSPGTLAMWTTVATVVVGEIITSTILVHRLTGSFDVLTALRILVPLTFGENYGYTFIKLIFAVTLGISINHVARRKEAPLRL